MNKPNAPEIRCKNGVRLSVQASRFHYCSPRNDVGPYSAKEVGFISKKGKRIAAPASWKPYAEDGTLKSDVFAWVPVRLINAFIKANGGRI